MMLSDDETEPDGVAHAQARMPRRGRPYADDTRADLLSGLHRLLIASHGRLPSVAEISRESGVNSSLVAYHFDSKDGLLLALLESILEPRKEQTQSLIKRDLPPLEKLRRYIHGLVTLYFEYPYLNSLSVHLVHSTTPEVNEKVSAGLVKVVQANQEELLQQAIDAGIVEMTDVKFFYFVLLGACERMFSSRIALDQIFGISEITPDLKQSYASYVERAILHGIIKDGVKI